MAFCLEPAALQTRRKISGPVAHRVCSRLIVVLGLMLPASVSTAQPIDRAKTELLTGLDIALTAKPPDAMQFHIGVGPILFSTLDGGAKRNSVGVLPLFAFQYRDLVAVDETAVRVNLSRTGSALRTAGIRFGPMLM